MWAKSQADTTPAKPMPSGIITGTDNYPSLESLGINPVPKFTIEEEPDWDRNKLWREFTPVTDKRTGTKWLGTDLSNAVFANIMLEPVTRLNEYTRKTEYRREPLADTDITRLRLSAMEVASLHGGEYSPTAVTFREAVLYVAHHRRYNPAIEALDALRWDGFPRLDLLGQYMQEPDTLDRLDQLVMKLIIIGVVARTYKPGCKFDYMPLIIGRQGAAKGNWLKTLAVIDGAYTASFNIHANDLMKHEVEVCTGKSIVEIGEQAGWDKQGTEDIKRFITMDEAEARKAYAYEAIVAKRTFVLVATVNTARLDDRTGNRRFPICDWKDTALDEELWDRERDQVLAEAVEYFKSGQEKPILPREYWQAFEERAEQHIEPTSFESWVQENIDHSWLRDGHTYNEFLDRYSSSPLEGKQGEADEDMMCGVGVEIARKGAPTARTFKPIMEQLGFAMRNTGRRREWSL